MCLSCGYVSGAGLGRVRRVVDAWLCHRVMCRARWLPTKNLNGCARLMLNVLWCYPQRAVGIAWTQCSSPNRWCSGMRLHHMCSLTYSVLSNMAGLRQVQDCIELLLEEIRTRDTTHSHLLECVAPRPLALSLPTSHLHGSQPTCTPVPVLCFPRLHHGRAIHGLHHDQGRGCACRTQREAIAARGLGRCNERRACSRGTRAACYHRKAEGTARSLRGNHFGWRCGLGLDVAVVRGRLRYSGLLQPRTQRSELLPEGGW